MNVVEINTGSLETLSHYVETTIPLTVFIFYIVLTLQPRTAFHEKGANLQRRAAWPILLLWRAVPERMKKFLRRGVKRMKKFPWRSVERRKKFLARKDEEGLIE